MRIDRSEGYSMLTEKMSRLSRMLNPASIALIGASSDGQRISGRALNSMNANGFQGRLYPVNPKGGIIQGRQAYARLEDIDAPIDLAVCSLPASAVLQAARQCAQGGVAGMVIYASGFAEIGGQGAMLQAELSAIARDSGMRILGPNTVGFTNYAQRVVASFHDEFHRLPAAGNLSVVSQSGAFLANVAMMGHERERGFRYLVATGNECDLQVADCIDFFALDPGTDVILCYLETCRDGARLARALAAARAAGKHVVAVKPGRTAAGARAAQSHTAALAGNDAIYEGLFRQYGVYRADSIEEYFDVGLAACSKVLANNRVCVITVSGGVGVMLADHAEMSGLELAELPPQAKSRIREQIPFSDAGNPIDVTGLAVDRPDLFQLALDAAGDARQYGGILVHYGAYLRREQDIQYQIPAWRRVREQYPGLVLAISGFLSEAAIRAAAQEGVLAYREPTDAIRVFAALAKFGADRPPPASVKVGERVPAPQAPVDEPSALQWFANAGIAVVSHRVAHSPEAAVQAARELGYPVVLKVVADGVLHKSDVGGVRVNLADKASVRQAFTAIESALKQHLPDKVMTGCIVAPMAPAGVEVGVGMVRDPVFGPVIMCGLGGILVEVLKDVSFRIAPFDVNESLRMLDELRGRAVLEGVRGMRAGDVQALAAAVSRLSVLAAAVESKVQSFEINPLRVLPRGQGVVALDAVIELSEQ